MDRLRTPALADLERLWALAETTRSTDPARAESMYGLLGAAITRVLRQGNNPVAYPELVGLLTAATEARNALAFQIGRWPPLAKTPGTKKPCVQHAPRSSESPASLPIVGFLHVAALNEWRALLNQLRERLIFSGLWATTERLYVGCLGSESDALDWNEPRVEILPHDLPLDAQELPTLDALWEWSQTHEALVYYLHTKGVVSEAQYPPVTDWRELMLQVVVDRHPECVALLDRFDAVGANWHSRPWRHFSGNFWWARTDYLRRLPRPANPPRRWTGPGPNAGSAPTRRCAPFRSTNRP